MQSPMLVAWLPGCLVAWCSRHVDISQYPHVQCHLPLTFSEILIQFMHPAYTERRKGEKRQLKD